MSEDSGEHLAKFVMRSVREIEFMATVVSWVMCFGIGAILLYLLSLWALAHMNVVIGVIAAQVVIAALGIWLGDD